MARLSLKTKCRKGLQHTLFFLAALLLIKVRLFNGANSADLHAHEQYLRNLVAETEAARERGIRDGSIWEGQLHRDFVPSDEYSTENMSLALGVQRRLSAEEVPLDERRTFRATIELHECRPGSESCASGGTLRVVRDDGTEILTCQVGLLQSDQIRPSYYELIWSAGVRSKSEHEKRELLRQIAGVGRKPIATTFAEDLQQAYASEAAQQSARKAIAKKLCKDILRAVLADRENSTVDLALN